MTEILTFEMYNTLTFYCKQDKVMDLAFWLAVHGKPVLFWKGISGLKFPCFLFYACLLPEWRWEPVEFRAIPILLRKLPNIC